MPIIIEEKKPVWKIGIAERVILITSGAIMLSIIVYELQKSEGLFWPFTLPHQILTAIVFITAPFGARYKILTHIITVLGVLGAMSAVTILTLLIVLTRQSA
ncbi:MAG TPA: hypothetical protein VJ841_01320 [Candidatus Saccharimonadales bacterium]|nr:hypothetical protein [Candidatus Saccharimonadales bacterium]